MSVDLDPPELGFRRPFTHEVTQVLKLHNTSSDPIAFKVKTTAPKQYCVRPNSGRIEGGSGVEVQVLLQAMKEDPPPDARCRDKFLVQSVAIPMEKEVENMTTIWQNVERTSKASIQERKIRVVFLPADGPTTTPQHNNVNGMRHDEAPPAYDSPSPTPNYGSPPHEKGLDSTPSRSTNPYSSDISSQDNGFNGSSKAATSNPFSAIGAAASNVASAIPTSSQDIQQQLANAKATVAKLQQQVEKQGLQQRKGDAVNQDARERISTGTTGMGVQQQPSEGVPVQLVAALCLLSFLLAYFLF
ncbi:phosphatidylinositol-binding protein scs2 [Schaereria dolodes]|nr:phosphatidylinositol-binding protein scs2 [Schaereria dolodes]